MLNGNRGRGNAALYRALNQSISDLWKCFEKFNKISFLAQGRMPNAGELPQAYAAAQELTSVLGACDEAAGKLAQAPRPIRPFFNIIPLLILYFRSLRECLAKIAALAEANGGEADPLCNPQDARFRKCLEDLEDCRKMAEELPGQWSEREQLLDEAALALGICRELGAEPANGGEQEGALAQFIAASRVRRAR